MNKRYHTAIVGDWKDAEKRLKQPDSCLYDRREVGVPVGVASKYSKLEGAACPSQSLYLKYSECHSAATTLNAGLNPPNIVQHNPKQAPKGCFLLGGELWFNYQGAEDPGNKSVVSICQGKSFINLSI